MTKAYSHVQVQVPHIDGTRHVDEGLADLLVALWSHGLETEWSCQGGLEPGDVSSQTSYTPSKFQLVDVIPVPSDPHIVFAHFDHAVRFLKRSLELLPRPQSYTDNEPAWSMAIQALPPESDGRWRGNAVWAHHLTGQLTQMWVAV